ncbi:hypothetical protein EKO04_006631 [Ascochyta lentis]|uniref:Uncharacterized protein n=1 Tax=Ascochyta lentis TaxID=205686 RepID=A0A8H7MI50_9PLEO|nr:hypothetical protein EKO04_006631 [Ascochyta lentis]
MNVPLRLSLHQPPPPFQHPPSTPTPAPKHFPPYPVLALLPPGPLLDVCPARPRADWDRRLVKRLLLARDAGLLVWCPCGHHFHLISAPSPPPLAVWFQQRADSNLASVALFSSALGPTASLPFPSLPFPSLLPLLSATQDIARVATVESSSTCQSR